MNLWRQRKCRLPCSSIQPPPHTMAAPGAGGGAKHSAKLLGKPVTKTGYLTKRGHVRKVRRGLLVVARAVRQG